MNKDLQTLNNRLLIAVVNTIISVFSIAMAAYALARIDFRGKQLLTSALSSALLIPVSALLMPLYIIMARIGLIDTKLGLILVYSAIGLPTTLFILRGAFLGIPREIDESAALDGKKYYIPALPGVKSVDATGAGDAFLAGFLYGLYHDCSIVDCICYGNAMGGRCVERIGCIQSKLNEEQLNNDAGVIRELFKKRYFEQ